MKRVVIMLLLMCTVGGYLAYSVWAERRADAEMPVHYHAGFRVYINGERQDYSDFKYMNFTACTEHGNKKSPEEEQIEKAHLHDGDGDVVHVHREGAVWGDLFRNIKISLPQESTVFAYKQGQAPDKIENVLQKPIEKDTSLIIIAGEDTNIKDVSDFVSLDRIREIESKSELCGT